MECEVRLRVREIIRQVCGELGVTVVNGALLLDHVHLPADIAFQAGHNGILSHHVEFITGARPMLLRGVFELCKGKDYNDC